MKQLSIRRALVRTAVVGTVVTALVGSYGVVDAGAVATAGVATITDPANSQAPLASGSAAKLFSVSLPAAASCPGDTATDGYKLYSFLVHSGTDIGSISEAQFGSTGPSVGFGITDNSGQIYGAVNVSSTPKGLITGIPNNFQWAQVTGAEGLGVPLTDLLYDSGNTTGTWSTGLLCADTNGVVGSYWTTSVTFSASNSDPAGFTWAAVPGGTGPTTPEVPLPVVLPLIALAVIGGAIVRGRRRRGRPAIATVST